MIATSYHNGANDIHCELREPVIVDDIIRVIDFNNLAGSNVISHSLNDGWLVYQVAEITC